ncbi:MAG: nucleotidyltransferase family protein [Deltaproteobacteria bacterium]|nr:nucleotidyltransferase family protein [Deltaproteobacteria bacterium]
MSHSSWTRLLALLLPDETDRLLLKMCTLEGEACARATGAWLAAVGSPTEYFRLDRQCHKRLLPLLAGTMRQARVDLPEDFGAVLRAAELHETLRARTFQRHALQILDTLLGAGIDVVLLPGVALVPRHYRDWPLRHCHDLDLWVAERDRTAVEGVLARDSVCRQKAPADRRGSSILETESGFQVALHTHLSPMHLLEPPREALLARRRSIVLEGCRVDTLGDTDLLFYVCLRAACSVGRRSLRWACDAVRLLDSSPAIDWEHFLETARITGAGLPLSVMLGFLSGELGAVVPPAVMQRLTDETALTPEFAEAFCHMVALNQNLHAGRLLRSAPDLRIRFALVRYLIFPSASFLGRERGLTGGRALSGEYLRRVRLATQRVAGLHRLPVARPLGNEGREGEERRV